MYCVKLYKQYIISSVLCNGDNTQTRHDMTTPGDKKQRTTNYIRRSTEAEKKEERVGDFNAE